MESEPIYSLKKKKINFYSLDDLSIANPLIISPSLLSVNVGIQ